MPTALATPHKDIQDFILQYEWAKAISQKYNEPEWLIQRRLDALKLYNDSPLPDRVSHLWRYTEPELFVPKDQAIQTAALQACLEAPENPQGLVELEAHSAEAVYQGGQLIHFGMDESLKTKGLILTTLADAARQHPALVEPYLSRLIPESHGKFEALNAAVWQGGLFLYVPRNLVIEKPIHLFVVGDNGTPFLASRLLAVIGEASQLTLVEEYSGVRDAQIHANSVTEIFVSQAVNLRHVILQRWGEQVVSHYTQRALIERDASVLSVVAGLGGRTIKADLGSRLNGRGANVKLLGMSFVQHSQHFDQHTVHEHLAGGSFSDLDFKVVLKDKARSVYTGLIRIDQNAPGCEAYQENRNLLLSDKTRADTIPELEIMTDEVRCTHGATIGPVDEQQLFYLEARGIPRDEAVRMVVAGFVEPTLKEVSDDLRERIRLYITERVKEI